MVLKYLTRAFTPCTPMEAQPAAPAVCTLDQYDLVGVIGKGSFGTVSRIRRKADGRVMVWKELNYGTMREKEKQLVVSEVRGCCPSLPV